uniref:trypsin n=1 Tax=Acanthochromis polyacanthus TaxID=80966 RepID=A0A3Q1GWX1_9TELE
MEGASASGIVGGRVSKPHSRPYMASLQFGKHHSCGGILIREDFVLTAAHCKDQQEMTVVLGAHDITKKEESQQRIQVAKYYPHPKYTKYDYDIMLLQVSQILKIFTSKFTRNFISIQTILYIVVINSV